MEKELKKFEGKQEELIHILHEIQQKYGYIPPQTLSSIAKHLKISEAEIYGVLTFYKGFSLEPKGKHRVTICMGTACHVRGAPMILDEFERQMGIKPEETSEDKLFSLETVNCVGACALGPIAIIDGKYHGHMVPQKVKNLIEQTKKEEE
ncbi:NAD(P)H-dependent oxidoreductase subunit E [bacterium]|nr:NAD(P)H-dependent oxidoreductase subunit E [bacterium]